MLHLAYLTNDGADATANTTWNGISFEQTGNGLPTQVDNTDQTVTVGSDGSVSFTVRDSQAVVANIGSKVGNVRADATACSAIAQRSPGIGSTSVSSSSHAASSTNAATSIRQGTSQTGSSASATATNGVRRLSAILFSTMGAALMAGALLVWT